MTAIAATATVVRYIVQLYNIVLSGGMSKEICVDVA